MQHASQIAGEANATWARARDDMRARAQHLRESTTNAFHRMTGTDATGATTQSGTAMTPADRADAMSGAPDSQGAPAAYSNQGVAPGPAAVDAGATQ